MHRDAPTGAIDLLQRIEQLTLVARHNVAGLLAGDYETSVRGHGLSFHETRKYVPGEPARRIDWNITARLGAPYVKVHLEERQREVIVALDTSPSMHTGFTRRTKLETGIELAATLAAAAIDAGDRLGHVLFADQVIDQSPPRTGRAQLYRVLASLLRHSEPWQRPVEASDPRVALHAIGRLRRGRFLIVLISDFIDHDLPEDLKFVRARHDVSLLHVYDPVETGAADERGPRIAGRAPEGPPDARNTGRARPESLDAMHDLLTHHAGKHRIAVSSIATDEPVRPALDRFFHGRGRLRTTAAATSA